MGELAFRAWEGVFGPDPGLLRLRSATRVLCAVTVTLVALLLLGRITAMPIGAIALGFMVSLFGTAAVRDPSPGQQRFTLLLMPLPALAASVLATLLSPWQAVADLGFLAVVFGATAVRGFGPRWMALGMLAYIAYFLGEVLHPPLSQIPAEVIALGVAIASGFLVRFVLLRERPAPVLRRAVRDIERRIGRILGQAEAILATGACGEAERRGLGRQVARLSEAALVAEDQIESLDAGRLKPAAERSRLGLRLFELELAGERVALLACAAAERGDGTEVERRRLATLGKTLRTGGRPQALSFEQRSAAGGRLGRAIDDLVAIISSLPPPEAVEHDARAWASPEVPRVPEEDEQPSGGDEGGERRAGVRLSPALRQRLSPALRQAIQVVAACGLAVGFGTLISQHRWYWAAITAFVVFSGTQSRGHTLRKALQRLGGTMAGVLAGIGVATMVSGHRDLAFALILACVFFAFYAFQAAYGVMIFWITNMVALLYGLLGYFKPGLLVLRLEETALGTVIGVLVATVVLPTSTRAVVRSAGRDFLGALAETAGSAVGRLGNRTAGAAGPARDLDRKMQALHAACRPLSQGWLGGTARSARTLLRAAMSCTFWSHELAHLGQDGAAPDPSQADRDIRDAADRVRRRAAALRERLEDRKEEDIEAEGAGGPPPADDAPPSFGGERDEAEAARYVLWRLDRSLERLGSALADL